jgi:hypothetical protein
MQQGQGSGPACFWEQEILSGRSLTSVVSGVMWSWFFQIRLGERTDVRMGDATDRPATDVKNRPQRSTALRLNLKSRVAKAGAILAFLCRTTCTVSGS